MAIGRLPSAGYYRLIFSFVKGMIGNPCYGLRNQWLPPPLRTSHPPELKSSSGSGLIYLRDLMREPWGRDLLSASRPANRSLPLGRRRRRGALAERPGHQHAVHPAPVLPADRRQQPGMAEAAALVQADGG